MSFGVSNFPATSGTLGHNFSTAKGAQQRSSESKRAAAVYGETGPIAAGLAQFWRPAISKQTLVVLKESPVSGAKPTEYLGNELVTGLLREPNLYQPPDIMNFRGVLNHFFDGAVIYLISREPRASAPSLIQEQTGVFEVSPPTGFCLIEACVVAKAHLDKATVHVAGTARYEPRPASDTEIAAAGGYPLAWELSKPNHGGTFFVPARDVAIFANTIGTAANSWTPPLFPFDRDVHAYNLLKEKLVSSIEGDISDLKLVDAETGSSSPEEVADALEALRDRLAGVENSNQFVDGDIIKKIATMARLEIFDDPQFARQELNRAIYIPGPLYDNDAAQFANRAGARLEMMQSAQTMLAYFGQALGGALLTRDERRAGIFIGPRSLTEDDPKPAQANSELNAGDPAGDNP